MKILYIMSSMNVYGGTPKKTLDLLRYFKNKSCIFFYSRSRSENLSIFQESGAGIFLPKDKSTIYSELRSILKIIDDEKVDIIHTQFFRGELLAYLAKLLRPRVKLIIAFVGPFNPVGIRKVLSHFFYKRTDAFVFISDYVKSQKMAVFPELSKRRNSVIFNGTGLRQPTKDPVPESHGFTLLGTTGLVDHKNIALLIEAMNILVNDRKLIDIVLFVAGDGPEKNNLQTQIGDLNLGNNVFLLGYQKNIGGLLSACDVFVHPAFAEGFGIAVIEAMMAGKPVIVSDAGALPELIDDKQNGLIVDAFNPVSWADAIEMLYFDESLSFRLGSNALAKAKEEFSLDRFVQNYANLYQCLLDNTRAP